MLQPVKEVHTRTVPNNKVFYAIALLWALGTLVLPMYKLYSYLILGVISVAAYFILRKFVFPDVEEEYEVETLRSYHSKLQQQFIEDGTKTLNNIIEINNRIDNPELNENVRELVDTSDKILDYVYEHETAASSLRKLVNYYLPTIEKLLTRYDEVEEQTVDKVVDSKKKVEDLIRTTNVAFRNQLNSLYDTDTLDINSEVKVLEKIFVQEGLIDLDNKDN
ncbi:MAG: 5-bromo-4-chloroindolyl phosphate hydrolysis family protein [Erysipelotrichaceae bacterium]|nr:5-bromo-4-chloroindolyl phosphate hydrolysis family protein [Erysipelotrichaceae bacterium]